MRYVVPHRQLEPVLAAAYQLAASSHTEHLRAIRQSWAPLSIGGDFTIASAWSAHPTEGAVCEHYDVPHPDVIAAASAVYAATPRAERIAYLRATPSYFAMNKYQEGPQLLRASRRIGFPDFRGIIAPTHTGWSLCVGSPTRGVDPDAPNGSPQLDGLAAHFAAGWRLRERLSQADAFDENAEAIMTPDGRIVDALGPTRREVVRERLRSVVLGREKALRGRSDNLWPALLDGRYTIIDRFERSGERYIVAHRNPGHAPSLNPLSSAERDVVNAVSSGGAMKVLAAERGISAQSFSQLLHRGLRKLGLSRAIELTLIATGASCFTLSDDQLGPEIIAAFHLRGPAVDAFTGLTAAEKAVLADLVRGLSNREIAARRNRSLRTVANQVATILGKTRAPNRRALVAALSSKA